MGQRLAERSVDLPAARRGVNESDEVDESFVAPFMVPKLPPNRLYFLFQQPIRTTPQDAKARLALCVLGVPSADSWPPMHAESEGLLPTALGPPLLISMQDRARCEELYREVRASVEGGIAWLLERRGRDPYASFTARALRERLYPGQQAPTFPLD